MSLSETTLAAYVDGELDAAGRAEVEAAAKTDPEVRAALARHQVLRGRLAQTYDPVLEEPAPEELEAFIRAAVGRAGAPAGIIDLAARRQARAATPPPSGGIPRWAAMAACFVCGVLVAAGGLTMNSPGLIRAQGRELLAQGLLARALDHDLASDPHPTSRIVRVGLSFRAHDGAYCRTFSAADGAPLSGVACRDKANWTLRAATFSGGAPSRSAYRTAASEIPPAVMTAVDGLIDGAPLDAQGEAAARAKGWRNPLH
jgi:hypothetical protein